MNKTLHTIFTIVAILCGIASNAQVHKGFEIGLGVHSFGVYIGDHGPGFTVNGAYRVDTSKRISYGTMLCIKQSTVDNYYEGGNGTGMLNRQFGVRIFTDYTLGQVHFIRPYVGARIGPTLEYMRPKLEKQWNKRSLLTLGPYAGIKIGDHIRLSAALDYDFGVAKGLSEKYLTKGLNLSWFF